MNKILTSSKKIVILVSATALVLVLGMGTVLAGSKAAQLFSGETAQAEITEMIGLQAAKDIALREAGFSSSEVFFVSAKQDMEDGRAVYEIEFKAGNNMYEFEIDAYTGSIIKREVESLLLPAGSVPEATPDGQTAPVLPGNVSLTPEAAKEVALAHAGLSASEVSFCKVELDDIDDADDRAHYDIVFTTGTHRYSYEIDAINSAVLEFECEALPQGAQNGNQIGGGNQPQTGHHQENHGHGAYIGVSAAKGIALKAAGLTAEDVRFGKVKLDDEDGVVIYEVKFYRGNMEYEYEINAVTGAILDVDIEPIDD